MKKQPNLQDLSAQLKVWARELGFQGIGITDTSLPEAREKLKTWLDLGYQGEMNYMARYGLNRADPAHIIPNTKRVIVVRMNYLPANSKTAELLQQKKKGFISRYVQDRDYHGLIRKRLQKLADLIKEQIEPAPDFRPFVDSGPIMEKPLAFKAGLGWIGKNTMLINPKAGSYFFLGTLLTNLELPQDESFTSDHCGRCSACLTICPTQAIIAPYVLDARRCISYLTIEYKGVIPIEFRKAIGNRIYGCDDCQMVCPWNKFAKVTTEIGFQGNRGFLEPNLLDLFAWTEKQFLKNTEGSPIRRIGYESWQRNLAIALGNAPKDPKILMALEQALPSAGSLLAEHICWAIQAQKNHF